MVMKMHVVVSWVIPSCSGVVGNQHFGRPSCLHLQGEVTEDGGSTALQNTGILWHHYMVS